MEKRHWKILLIIGIIFHIIAAYMMPIGLDAHVHATYVTDQMNDGEGDLEWGELRQDSKFGSTPEQVSSEDKWFAWHMIMQIWFTIFGVSILSMHLLSLAIGLACLAVIYFVTNSLFGKDRALTLTALASIYPPLIRGTGRLYQESAILLLTSLAIYCVVKGLQNPNRKKWWIFPIISIFIICSFKGMPLWMGLVAVVGFYLSQKVQFNLITFTFLAFSTEVFVIYRNGVSLLSVDVIIALISSLIAAVIFLY
ncbi:MAG: glycosyltransferase family 39 protein, partial [Euryarchaeota archaeon]